MDLFTHLSPGGDLKRYKSLVSKFEYLTAEEEHECFRRIEENGCTQSRDRVIFSQLNTVVRFGQKQYGGYSLPEADLIQEGNTGLIEAIVRFDRTRGNRFITFAHWYIVRDMTNYVLRNFRMVKFATTRGQKKAFFNLRKSRTTTGVLTIKEADEIAADLGIGRRDVMMTYGRFNSADWSFDGAATEDREGAEPAYDPESFLGDTSFEPHSQVSEAEEKELRSEIFKDAMKYLDPRSRDVIEKRWFCESKTSLACLAEVYDMTAEGIRQIEKRAMVKIRTHFENTNPHASISESGGLVDYSLAV